MKKRWTRRRFLRASVQGSLAVGGAALLPGSSVAPAPTSPALGSDREALRLAIDHLIPRQAANPAASELGGLAYLDARAASDETFRGELERVLARLEESAGAKQGRSFARLAASERIDVLQDVERTAGDLFASLRDAVYEAYYTRPDVWTRIGYEFHAGPEARPSVAHFDESALAGMRKRPKLYREVG
jgi:hypothetical protein